MRVHYINAVSAVGRGRKQGAKCCALIAGRAEHEQVRLRGREFHGGAFARVQQDAPDPGGILAKGELQSREFREDGPASLGALPAGEIDDGPAAAADRSMCRGRRPRAASWN